MSKNERAPSTIGPVDDQGSRLMAALCVLLAITLPLATGVYLVKDWPAPLVAGASGMGVVLQLSVQAGWRLFAAGVLSMLPVLAMAVALWRASRCLRAFARAEHFSLTAVRELQGFAALMLVAGVASAVVPTLIILLLTTGGPGQASLTLAVSSQHLLLLLFAGLTWKIASVLAKAVALAEEHAQIV